MRALRSNGVLISLLVLVGCGGSPKIRPGNDDAAFADLPALHLVLPAELSIGSSMGSGPDALSGRVIAARLPNGVVAIADEQVRELNYFDATGRFIRTVGRAGTGPGEFKSLAWVGTCGGDSLYAFDFSLRRMSVFDQDGQLARSFILHSSEPAMPVRRFACDTSGHFVVAPYASGSNRPREATSGYVVPVALTDDTGTVIRTLREFSGVQQRRGGRDLVLGAANGRVYAGDGTEFAVTVMDFDGDTVGRLARPWVSEAITDDVWDAFLESLVIAEASDKDRRDQLEYMRSRYPRPDTFAPYDTLIVDATGDVWIRALRTHRVPHTWVIFSPDGPAIARLTMPMPEPGTEVRLWQVDSSHALVRAVDSMGVNTVRVFRVDRGTLR